MSYFINKYKVLDAERATFVKVGKLVEAKHMAILLYQIGGVKRGLEIMMD